MRTSSPPPPRAQAVRIDEWAGETLTTSMVDDVFFILAKCGRRAMATGSPPCVCAILGQVNALLSTTLRPALEAKCKVQPCFFSNGLYDLEFLVIRILASQEREL